jgi:beta-1,2-mannobiose phosphorylase / 1,2-beta-oligomannan phosphorylase
MTTLPGVPYQLTRIGVVMTPDASNPLEAEGVLNPASGRDENGDLYLLPRLVAEGNVSRVGLAKVLFTDGVPSGVEREGIVLAPDRRWERGTNNAGTEDPRTTWVPSLGLHLMTYVAFGPLGPHPAIAVSENLRDWRRLGPIQFQYVDELDTDLNLYPNKDVVFFPEVVPDPEGRPSYAMLHRPMWELSWSRPGEDAPLPAGLDDDRPGIWISYIPAEEVAADISALVRPRGHRIVALSLYDWEALKIGSGPAPIRVPEGWLLIHHGVAGEITGSGLDPQTAVRYAAGAMILDAADPSQVIARTTEPLMSPETADETSGTVANVVFPTAIEAVGDDTFVFYGMADSKIGVARLTADSGRPVGE